MLTTNLKPGDMFQFTYISVVKISNDKYARVNIKRDDTQFIFIKNDDTEITLEGVVVDKYWFYSTKFGLVYRCHTFIKTPVENSNDVVLLGRCDGENT